MEELELLKKFSQKYAMPLDEFVKFGSALAFKEKKRLLQIERLEILARYDAQSPEDLKNKIKTGHVIEHPAWEDLIELKNIEADIRELENDIQDLQAA